MRIYVIAAAVICCWLSAPWAQENTFVGSQACKDCHEKEYESFTKYAKKADSFAHIKVMEKKLTPEEFKSCFTCHTTGYGQPGGFVSEQETPELKQPGCEVCHGPGSEHAETEDPDLIIASPDMDLCKTCHDETRVQSFNFRPLKYGGAH